MNKRRLHHVWTKFRRVKPWYFLALTIICGAICVFALRANNEHMVKLRNAVYAADQRGTGVEGALKNLQLYVTSHMNTNLSTGTSVYPPIQLKYTYQRLLAAQQNQQAQAGQANTQLYTEAQTYCQQQDPVDFSGHNRVPCIEQYVESHGTSTQIAAAAVPPALYEFSFASPRWSPDLAGWSLVAAIVSAVLFVVSLALDRWFRRRVA